MSTSMFLLHIGDGIAICTRTEAYLKRELRFGNCIIWHVGCASGMLVRYANIEVPSVDHVI